VRAVSRLCEFYPGICLTAEEKTRKNLSQSKKTLSHVKKNLSLRGTSVRIQYTFTKTHTHYKTHTYTHTRTRTRTHVHITKQYKSTTVQIKTKCI